jgi:hypothetical protein
MHTFHTFVVLTKSRMIKDFGHPAICGHEKLILIICRQISEDERNSLGT